mmetsp:Transcript_30025/g.96061  ORF Transcript_30025/g.96061 Transcript_30025/m.96061 type:complete len:350 (-) Transcript_30025:11-1060(-)
MSRRRAPAEALHVAMQCRPRRTAARERRELRPAEVVDIERGDLDEVRERRGGQLAAREGPRGGAEQLARVELDGGRHASELRRVDEEAVRLQQEGRLVRLKEEPPVVHPRRHELQHLLRQHDRREVRLVRPVDRVKDQDATRLEHTPHLGYRGRQIEQMLHHVRHQHAVEGVVREGRQVVGVTRRKNGSVGEPMRARVGASLVERARGRVDPGHLVAERSERDSCDAAATPDLEVGARPPRRQPELLSPDAVKVGDARRVEELQGGELVGRVVRVPARADYIVVVDVVVDARAARCNRFNSARKLERRHELGEPLPDGSYGAARSPHAASEHGGGANSSGDRLGEARHP